MKEQYLFYILDVLKPHGPITSKPLFGGYGIYYGPHIIGIILENQFYFKVDGQTKPDFDALDCKPFVYAGKNKEVVMPYMTAPESILENREELPQWIEKAYQVALRSKK